MTCPSGGAQNQLLVNTMYCVLSIAYTTLEGGTPFPPMDIFCAREKTRRHLDITFSDPLVAVHPRNRRARVNRPAAAIARGYPRPVQVYVDEHSNKLVTLSIESFSPLGNRGSNFIDRLAISKVGTIICAER